MDVDNLLVQACGGGSCLPPCWPKCAAMAACMSAITGLSCSHHASQATTTGSVRLPEAHLGHEAVLQGLLHRCSLFASVLEGDRAGGRHLQGSISLRTNCCLLYWHSQECHTADGACTCHVCSPQPSRPTFNPRHPRQSSMRSSSACVPHLPPSKQACTRVPQRAGMVALPADKGDRG